MSPAIRRRVINHVAGSAERVLFDPEARDNCTEPYIKLRDRFAEHGYLFEGVTDQPLTECRWIIFWDTWGVDVRGVHHRLMHRAKAKLGGSPVRDVFNEAIRAKVSERLVLFMFEPPSVYPRNWDAKLHQHFRVVFTWDPALVDGRKYHRIYLPNPTVFPKVDPVPFSKRKLLVDISGYKFSNHERELFTERRRLVRFFTQRVPTGFDLFGEGWNMTWRQYMWRRLRDRNVRREFFPAYRGPVRHKWDVYPHYKFGVCYENIADQPGYVSLKIFDCMRAGCVPVYLGAPDIASYVDRDAFVDRRLFRSNDDLARFISEMSEREHARYLDAARDYLESSRFKPFLAEHFVDRVIGVLEAAS
ncbi:MAG TPA: glycosyltransferase family 10 [bacterium]|nr:glycosyltransferase family 10 [bacterium]